ncbi:hypothetical protein [Rhodococcus phage RGL3]|uniref:Helix-turn-helix DNA-binding domain protein n=1 Tax=Rhodococcus phage RGL3 TaxID=2922221 RepID=G9FHM4_9CAUD|nr:HTH DNA binding protein [Rhodococcus phage RGL3]AEV52112.1 hypothetical protein [Rhodococcus phage RGL3]
MATNEQRIADLEEDVELLEQKVADLEDEIARLRNNRPKLSAQDVRDIRSAYKRKEATTAELADMFGVNRATIYRTVVGVYH